MKGIFKMGISPHILDDVAKLLTAEPQRASQIHRKLNCWAAATVKKACDVLVDQKRAVMVAEPIPSGCVHLYKAA